MKPRKAHVRAMVVMAVLMLVWLCMGTPRTAQAASKPTASQPPPAEASWPRRFETNGHVVLLYQPQVDAWENYARIAFRAVVAVQPSGKKESAYGVIDVEADTETDMENRTVRATNLKREVRFAAVPAEEAARLVSIVDAAIPRQESVVVSLDLVLAYIRSSPAQQRAVEVNLAPPKIFYSQRPAILVMFMGEPKLKPVNNTPLMFAINTNWDMFYDPGTSHYFLLNEKSWLTTADPLKGPWTPAKSLPASLTALPDDPNWADAKQAIPGKPATKIPVVFTSTEPAEMILVDGEPTYSPVPGTKLLYVSNTASILFLHTGEQQYYFQVAGRWFRAQQLTGPWAAASTDLPEDFRRIPENHPLAPVRASVPGTEEARDAVLLASVPTKTTVKVGQAPSASVAYEGTPKFEAISNTGVSYAVNTPNDVFVVQGNYYWVYQGIWYCSTSPQGPWTVCPSVPQAIYQIPASHPKHNVTYAYVYDSTPTTVYVGYTSGYQGEYVASGVLMFGAGLLVGAAIANNNPYYYYGWPPPPAYYSYGAAVHYSYHHGGYYGSAHAYGPYGSAGAWAGYNPATGTYARGGYASGPYASGGWASAYNPYTGGRAVAGQVSTPYGSRGGYAAYNPYTGAYSRGGYASGPRGSVYAQAGYNPSTGTSGARAGYETAYGSGGRGYVQQGDEWARGGYRSTSQGTVGGVQTSKGGAATGVKTQQGSAFVGKTASGDYYAGKDGTVYKKDQGGSWQKNTGSGWETAEKPQQQAKPAGATSSSQRARSGQPTTTQAPTGAQAQTARTAQTAQRATESRPATTSAATGAQAQTFGGSQFAANDLQQLNRDAAARQRSEQMTGSSRSPQSRTGDFSGRASSGGGGGSFGGRSSFSGGGGRGGGFRR